MCEITSGSRAGSVSAVLLRGHLQCSAGHGPLTNYGSPWAGGRMRLWTDNGRIICSSVITAHASKLMTSLYIKRGKVSVTYVRNVGRGQLSSEWRHNENDVIMRTRAASAVGARRHNENDVTMTVGGLWRCGDWRHVATGCTALVFTKMQTTKILIGRIMKTVTHTTKDLSLSLSLSLCVCVCVHENCRTKWSYLSQFHTLRSYCVGVQGHMRSVTFRMKVKEWICITRCRMVYEKQIWIANCKFGFPLTKNSDRHELHEVKVLSCF